MIAGDFNKFIQYFALLLFTSFEITFSHYFSIFLDAFGVMLPPFFGNSIYEATIPLSVTLIMSQCGTLDIERMQE